MMVGLGLGGSGLSQSPIAIVIYWAVKIAFAVLVAYFAKRRGYNFWVFLVAAGLFDIFASALILISLGQREDKTA